MATKKLRMLTSMAGPLCVYDIHGEYDFEAAEAGRLVSAGIAEYAETEAAVSKKPTEKATSKKATAKK